MSSPPAGSWHAFQPVQPLCPCLQILPLFLPLFNFWSLSLPHYVYLQRTGSLFPSRGLPSGGSLADQTMYVWYTPITLAFGWPSHTPLNQCVPVCLQVRICVFVPPAVDVFVCCVCVWLYACIYAGFVVEKSDKSISKASNYSATTILCQHSGCACADQPYHTVKGESSRKHLWMCHSFSMCVCACLWWINSFCLPLFLVSLSSLLPFASPSLICSGSLFFFSCVF